MSFVFLHTADWQLGRPFASVRDEGKRHRLREERLEVVRRMANVVVETGAKMVLVAGDLFDSSKATRATVSAACAAIGALKVPVLVIPGNHDHGGPGSIWEQAFFRREQEELAPNLRVLLKAEPVVMEELRAVVFPAPLLRRHESGDVTAWIRSAAREVEDKEDWPRVVLAHGTVQGFGSAGSEQEEDEIGAVANFIDVPRLPLMDIDYVALGDWHGAKQVGEKAWYAGTPELDRFAKGEDNEPGYVLKVGVERGKAPVVEKLRMAKFSWSEMTFYFAEDAGVDLLAGQLEERMGTQGDQHVLKLTLGGSLGIVAADRLDKMLESWEARLLRLKLENRVTMAPSVDELESLTRRAEDPLVMAVAGQLVVQLDKAGNEDEAEVARMALRELHAACLSAQ